MDLIQSAVLGLVEGITEFLPISSTGHLILVSRWFGQDSEFTNMFNIVIQFGAILALPFIFGKRLLSLDQKISIQQSWNLWSRVLLAIVPALALGFIFSDLIEGFLFHPIPVALALGLGGLGLIFLDRDQNQTGWDWSGLTYKRTLLIGLFQCLALWPGVSRSAATIIGALLLGANRKTAAEFSFYLALPVLGLAATYSFLKFSLRNREAFILSPHDGLALLIGFVVSGLVAFIVSKWFLHFISKHNFKPFGFYRLGLALVVLSLTFLT